MGKSTDRERVRQEKGMEIIEKVEEEERNYIA
jgi:hypothetical protein